MYGLIASAIFYSLTVIIGLKYFYKIIILSLVSLIVMIIYFCFSQILQLEIENEYQMKVIEVHTNYLILKYGWTKKIYYKLNYYDPEFTIGDIILFKGYLTDIHFYNNVYSFDFEQYLNNKNIIYQVNMQNIIDVQHSKMISNAILNYVTKNDQSGLIDLLIFGQHQANNDELYTLFVDLNLVHLIVLSGMHINVLSSLILFGVNKIHKSKYNFLFPCGFSLLYWIILSFKFSIFRSIIMLIFFSFNKQYLNSKYNNFQIWTTALLFTNLLYPIQFLSSGFLYSFLTTLGLIFLNKQIKHLNFWWKMLIFNISIWFITLGLNIYFNYHINFLSIFYNMLLEPIISFIFTILVIVMWFPFNFIIAKGLNYCLLHLVSLMGNFNWQLNVGKLSLGFVIMYYLLIIIVFNYFYKLKVKILFISFYSLLLCSWNWMILPNYQIVMLDVGNGNSIIIQDKYHFKNFMFDAGVGINHFESQDQDYLEYAGISWLNNVIISHYHSDHYNNYQYIKQHNIVLNCIDNSHPINTVDKIGGCELYYLNNNSHHSNDENDNSLVILLKIYNYKFLLTGDATAQVEKNIGNNQLIHNVDFLQVPHHGSNTSLTTPFLNWVNPTNALISATYDQQQNFPTEETIEKLETAGCDNIFITSQAHNIKIKIWKNHYQISFF
ncbi:ComEC/Rec2 family competence protein [Spiroplasma endosymbiont of Amphibalanus improvisus]|uniref:ComEC/Rec2 family competence protein n=1 Tax=Spiroplasma endosymbiont of Amphibalanus improvisus TaxID=3066327 RepID=UPI00313CE2CA